MAGMFFESIINQTQQGKLCDICKQLRWPILKTRATDTYRRTGRDRMQDTMQEHLNVAPDGTHCSTTLMRLRFDLKG